VALAVLLGVNMIALAWVLLRRTDAPAAPPGGCRASTRRTGPAQVSVNTQTGMVTVPATVTLPTTVNIPINSRPA
jgi:hypothetical protein